MNNSIGKATRKVFIPLEQGNKLVDVKNVEFDWHKGMSYQVRQRSLDSFHQNIIHQNIACNPLEISSKSRNPLGVQLSAFNLTGKIKDQQFTVETLFQSSKVFLNDENSPYRELLYKTSKEAKTAPEIKNKQLIYFQHLDQTKWELEPKTAFYDWVYINTLLKYNQNFANEIRNFDAFTDIEFNHKKSISSQAYSVALYKALDYRKGDLIYEALKSKENFLQILNDFNEYKPDVQSIKLLSTQQSLL